MRLVIDPAVSATVDQQRMSPDTIAGQRNRCLAEKTERQNKRRKNRPAD
jgi:hypothetical protein